MKKCTCGEENPDHARFCANCGKPMDAGGKQNCPRCGTENPSTARFCVTCGGPMGGLAPNPPPVVRIQPDASNNAKKKSRPGLGLILGITGGVVMVCLCMVVAVAMFSPSSKKTTVKTIPTQAPSASTTESASQSPAGETPQPEQPEPTQVEPSPSPDASEVGRSKDNPAPLGTPLEVDGISIVVNEVKRPANDVVKQGNSYNRDPKAGDEYIMVKLSLQCTKTSDQKCNFISPNAKLSGSSGILNDIEIMIIGVPDLLVKTEFYGGASTSGWLVYQVKQGETNLVLSIEPFLSLDKAFFSMGQ